MWNIWNTACEEGSMKKRAARIKTVWTFKQFPQKYGCCDTFASFNIIFISPVCQSLSTYQCLDACLFQPLSLCLSFRSLCPSSSLCLMCPFVCSSVCNKDRQACASPSTPPAPRPTHGDTHPPTSPAEARLNNKVARLIHLKWCGIRAGKKMGWGTHSTAAVWAADRERG